MLTTNLAFEGWTEIFGSERLTGALLDRLTHRSHILEAKGESYRFRQARERSTGKPSPKQDSNQA
jgi:DNA replication protein DnaC